MVRVLIQCGDNLTPENVMRQTEDLHGLVVAMLLLGITIDTSFTDFAPIKDADDAIHGRAVGVVRTDYGRRAWWQLKMLLRDRRSIRRTGGNVTTG